MVRFLRADHLHDLSADTDRLTLLAQEHGWARALRPFGVLLLALLTPSLWTLGTNNIAQAAMDMEKEC